MLAFLTREDHALRHEENSANRRRKRAPLQKISSLKKQGFWAHVIHTDQIIGY